MADSAITPLFSYLGWSFLPNFGTQIVQSLYYKITITAGQPHPQPGTPQHARDYRRIRVLVLCLYLLYTLTQSLYDIKLAGDFYTLLSLSPSTATDKEIRTRVRRLAARYHPDKISSDDQIGQKIYLQLRLASETLTNPSHRYAYTHFGPSILTHLPKPEDSSTSQPFNPKQLSLETAHLVILALKQKIPSYLLSLLFVVVLNTFLLPSRQGGKYWRYLILAASFALETYLITHDTPTLPLVLSTPLHYIQDYTSLSSLLPPHLLPFQLLNLTSSLALSLNIFISQISALYPTPSTLDTNDPAALQTWLTALTTNLSTLSTQTARIDAEASTLLQTQFVPYKGDPASVRDLRRGMKEGMVIGGVKMHPEVQGAVRRVLERRKRAVQGGTGSGSSRDQTNQQEQHRPDGADVVDLLGSDEQFT